MRVFLISYLLNDFPPPSRSLEQARSVNTTTMQTQAQGLWTKVSPESYEAPVLYRISLRASFPIWASEPGLSSRVRASRASTFHDIPEMESLLAG